MPYPLLAEGTDVAAAATGYIEAYDAVVAALIATKQLDADVMSQLTTLRVSMAADIAILATVTNAA